jgi:hypothetical protein
MKYARPSIGFLVVLVSLFFPASAWSSEEVILGVLENFKITQGESRANAVRILFKKTASDWIAFKSECAEKACLTSLAKEYPAEVKWTIALDGQRLGELVGRTPPQFAFYSHIGRQALVPGAVVPKVGKPNTEFSGWSGDSVLRPLVAVSQPFFKDPQQWKPASSVDPQLLASLKKAFKKKHPQCECGEFDDEQPPCKPTHYADSRLVVEKQYASTSLEKVVKLKLRCGGRFVESDETFAVSAQGAINALGKRLKLIDAGDYDGDGRSELLFLASEYNRDEYQLFSDGFSKKAVYGWSYH